MNRFKELLETTKWKSSTITEIKGDASLRKYYRIKNYTSSAILMDTSKCIEILQPYYLISNDLRLNNHKSPVIYKYNPKNNLTIIEDFGDITLYQFLNIHPDKTISIYKIAIETLISFQNIPYSEIYSFLDTNFLKKEIKIFIDWYLPYQRIELKKSAIDKFWEIWQVPLQYIEDVTTTKYFVHKDFHGGNLMILPNQKIGIIDFQAAKFGNQIYDLVSFLYDCRQDISKTIIKEAENYFLERTGLNKQIYDTISKIFIVQRNLKILGNFSSIFLNQSNSKYLQYLKPAWKLILENIDINIFDGLNQWLNTNIKKKEYDIYSK